MAGPPAVLPEPGASPPARNAPDHAQDAARRVRGGGAPAIMPRNETPQRRARRMDDVESGTDAGAMRKRSIVIAGHRTSVSLENAFWAALKTLARERGAAVSRLVAEIDRGRTGRSEETTSDLPALMRNTYAVLGSKTK